MRKLKVTELNRITVEEFKIAEKIPLVIVLDDIRSVYNVGSVFRTSDAFRVAEIVLCGITAQPPMAEIHKTALGAEDSVKWTYYKNAIDAIDDLLDRGYHIMAVEQVENSVKMDKWKLLSDVPYALVLGNEVKGVQQCVIDKCHESLEIPQFGTKHSLNVSNTASIVIWHYWYLLNH